MSKDLITGAEALMRSLVSSADKGAVRLID